MSTKLIMSRRRIAPRFTGAAALLLGALVLSGCTDSSIRAVKEASHANSDFTYGEVFGNAKGCKSTNWSSSEDDNGRPVVEFRCTAELTAEAQAAARRAGELAIKQFVDGREQTWKQLHAKVALRPETVQRSLDDERRARQAKLAEAEGELQRRQTELQGALERPVENPVMGPNGRYRRSLHAWTEEAKASTVQRHQQHVAVMEPVVAAKQAELDALPDIATYTYDGKTQAEYAQLLAQLDAIKEPYFNAVKEVEKTLTQRMEEGLAKNAKQKLELQVLFSVKKKGPVELTRAQWLVDGKPDGDMNVVLLAAAIVRPAYMPEILQKKWSAVLKVPLSHWDEEKGFPYRCHPDVPTGCEVRKPEG